MHVEQALGAGGREADPDERGGEGFEYRVGRRGPFPRRPKRDRADPAGQKHGHGHDSVDLPGESADGHAHAEHFVVAGRIDFRLGADAVVSVDAVVSADGGPVAHADGGRLVIVGRPRVFESVGAAVPVPPAKDAVLVLAAAVGPGVRAPASLAAVSRRLWRR
jgi:hypothetical protein